MPLFGFDLFLKKSMTVASKELGLYATEPSGIFDATSILARLDALETA